MSVYYIAEHIITDPVKFEEYRVKVAPMIASYGGRYITKAGSHKFPESPHWKPERVVIIEFPTPRSSRRRSPATSPSSARGVAGQEHHRAHQVLDCAEPAEFDLGQHAVA
jgi:uncharacterized protein (DUF1330 family)